MPHEVPRDDGYPGGVVGVAQVLILVGCERGGGHFHGRVEVGPEPYIQLRDERGTSEGVEP